MQFQTFVYISIRKLIYSAYWYKIFHKCSSFSKTGNSNIWRILPCRGAIKQTAGILYNKMLFIIFILSSIQMNASFFLNFGLFCNIGTNKTMEINTYIGRYIFIYNFQWKIVFVLRASYKNIFKDLEHITLNRKIIIIYVRMTFGVEAETIFIKRIKRWIYRCM